MKPFNSVQTMLDRNNWNHLPVSKELIKIKQKYYGSIQIL